MIVRIKKTCSGGDVSWYELTNDRGDVYSASIPNGWAIGDIVLPVDLWEVGCVSG